MCPREHFALYKSPSMLVLCYKKDWDTLLHLCYTCYLLPITNYLITKLSVTDNFSALMTHKYRESIVVLSISKSGFQQGIVCRH